MRISDVAKRTGVPISTIRYYERHAITPKPARHGRDRVYSGTDIRAIQFVRDAQSLDLPLREISTLLQGDWTSGEMAERATQHRDAVQKKIDALNRIDQVLAALERCTCANFAECDVTASCCKRSEG